MCPNELDISGQPMNYEFFHEKGKYVDKWLSYLVKPCEPELKTPENRNDQTKCLVDSLD
jgi:hypothetical protein